MIQNTSDADTRRLLEELRRGHRQLKITVTALILLLAVVPFALQLHGILRRPGTVAAEGFLVRDRQERMRLHLGYVGDDSFVTVFGAQGKPQLQLLVTQKGPVLTLFSSGGEVVGVFGAETPDAYIKLLHGGQLVSVGEADDPAGRATE
jgi:hypothetical protein